MATQIIGIVNITPDSFSDGGRFQAPQAALEQIETLLADGAAVIDLGAESTRPGAVALSPEEEWARLGGVLSQARRQFPQAIFSVDTRHGETAQRALESGADWINDVSGAADTAMAAIIARHPDCRYVLMHALGIPADPAQTLPEGTDILPFMREWFESKRNALNAASVADEQLIFDPGIGFGKTAEQSWQLIRGMADLADSVTVPLLAGHSRKSFLKTVTNAPAQDRDLETHVVSAALAAAGVAYLRVHDVAGTRRALAVAHALTGG